jgi:hypothetical protein
LVPDSSSVFQATANGTVVKHYGDNQGYLVYAAQDVLVQFAGRKCHDGGAPRKGLDSYHS